MEETPRIARQISSMRARTRWPLEQGAFWGAAAAASIVILLCTANSAQWLTRPFPGFFVWENLFVAAVGDTDWTGYQAGIPFQTRLVSVDGQRIASAVEVYRIVAALPDGTPVRYAFQPPTGDAVSIAVPT